MLQGVIFNSTVGCSSTSNVGEFTQDVGMLQLGDFAILRFALRDTVAANVFTSRTDNCLWRPGLGSNVDRKYWWFSAKTKRKMAVVS